LMGDIGKVRSAIAESGIDLDLRKFDHRVILQKTIFLLQMKGMDMGYRYGMYLRGPYSPDLTRDVLGPTYIKTRGSDLTGQEREWLHDLVERFSNSSVDLEISATYAYLRGVENLSAFESADRTLRMKSFYTKGKVSVAISKTIGFLFPLSEEEIEEMKEEFADLDRGSIEDLGRCLDDEG